MGVGSRGPGRPSVWILADQAVLAVLAALIAGALACDRPSLPAAADFAGGWVADGDGAEHVVIVSVNTDGGVLWEDGQGTYPATVEGLSLSVPDAGVTALLGDDHQRLTVGSAQGGDTYHRIDADQARAGLDQERMRVASVMLRDVGTGIFAWMTDAVDGPADPTVHIHPVTVEELRSLLVPDYLQQVPARDPWGHPLEYSLAVENVRETPVARIVCGGPDGDTGTEDDITWEDGVLSQAG